jgi:hypothetical protein
VETAVALVWSIALLGALALTVILVAQVMRVIHHVREINRLADVTLPAAQGIASNTAVLAALEGVGGTVGRLLTTAQAIDRVAAAIEGRTAALRRALGGGGR